MSVIQRAIEVGKEEGIGTLVSKMPPYIYQQLWPYLPEREGYTTKNEIQSSQRGKILDGLFPDYLTQYTPAKSPDYENQYIGGIRRHITEGENVVLIGGGEGISTVAAAKQVQSGGQVNVFEGGSEEVKKTEETVDVNNVSDVVTVHHAIVSNDYSLRSSPGDAEVILPSELPECDTLAIDADGAEIPILEDISIKPDKLIIEHHAVPNGDKLIVEYQPDKVRSLIQNMGCEIIKEQSDPNGAGQGRFEERIFVAKRS